MSRAKTERMLNLVLCLLSARRYLSKEEIREAVPGYPQGPEAFARAFERDKDELRCLGVPVQTGVNNALFDDEVGYRIPADAYALPQISLTTHEWALVELASRAWRSSALAADAQRAMLKLRAEVQQGQEQQPPADSLWLDEHELGVTSEADPDLLAVIAQAVSARTQVRFAYRKAGQHQAKQRTVQPWGLVAQRGRWYLVGFDADRSAQRVFRLARVQAPMRPHGPPGAFEIPAGLDLAGAVSALSSPTERPAQGRARLALAPGAGSYFRRYAHSVHPGAHPAPQPGEPDWDVVELDYADVEHLAGQVVGLAGRARLLHPPQVVQAVAAHARAVLAATRAQAPAQEVGV